MTRNNGAHVLDPPPRKDLPPNHGKHGQQTVPSCKELPAVKGGVS